MNEEERSRLREFFVKCQLLYKLNIKDEYTDEEVELFNTMRDKHYHEYAALWKEVAEETNGEPWRG